MLNDMRKVDRRIDKSAAKIRVRVAALKRTIGIDTARRYLEQNGYEHETVESLLSDTRERRLSKRRLQVRTAFGRSSRNAAPVDAKDRIVDDLQPEDLKLLYRLRLSSDADAGSVRLVDCPPMFAQFGLIEQSHSGNRITERGRATLLRWTRAKTLWDLSRGRDFGAYDKETDDWLVTNHFVAVVDHKRIATPRGQEWLAPYLKTLNAMG